MAENIYELKKIKSLFEEKQKNFRRAMVHHMCCMKRIEQLDIKNSNVEATNLIYLFNILDAKLLKAKLLLKNNNEFLMRCNSVKSFNTFVKIFDIYNIDSNLVQAYKIYNRFYKQCVNRGYVFQDGLDSMKQTNFIVMQLYETSIEQLQLCIDFIDKAILRGDYSIQDDNRQK